MSASGRSADALAGQAVALYGAGRLVDAAAAARAALEGAPLHAASLHVLALTRLAEGEFNDGTALLARALDADPDRHEARLHLGMARAAEGRHAEATELLAAVLGQLPDLVDARAALAASQWEIGERDAAIATYRRVVDGRPEDAVSLRNLANALRQHDAAGEAVAAFEGALALRADDVESHIGLAEALVALERSAEALVPARAALALRPDGAAAMRRLGHVLLAGRDMDGALRCLTEAVARNPEDASGQIALANLHSLGASHDAAEARYRDVLARHPDSIAANINLAMLDLLRGDFASGWPRYEWRRGLIGHLNQAYDPATPPWIAPFDMTGQSVQLVLEQGHGDTLQFLRYVPLLAARGARVEIAMRIQPALEPLIQGMPGVAAVYAPDATPPAAELVLPLLSLPLAFGTTLETIPGGCPYLAVPAERRARWRQLLAQRNDDRPRIGIVWAGSTTHPNDRLRSVPLAQFRRLLARPDLAYHVLQTPVRASDAAQLEGVAIRHAGIDDFGDTAALIEAMDLVVSVDTSVAHLAGALARPAWVLLPFNPDFRWLLGRADSPWYPSLRLFRQSAHAEWDDVLTQVQEAIDARFPRA